MNVQACTLCKKILHISQFSRNAAKETGYSNVCKACSNEAARKYREANKDKVKQSYTRWSTAKRANRVEQGMCVKCSRPKLSNHLTQCDFHCVQDAAKLAVRKCDNKTVKLLLDRFYSNPICPYTGEPLQLGLNAHLDHIQPKSKFPEIALDVNNLEWISERANLAKSGLSKAEFIELCHLIAFRHPVNKAQETPDGIPGVTEKPALYANA